MQYKTGLWIKRILMSFIVCLCLIALWMLLAERNAVTTPQYEKAPLAEIVEKDELTEEDYELLWTQTGLKQSAVDDLWRKTDRRELLYREQNRLFHPPDYECRGLTGFVKVEVIHGRANFFRLYDLQPGDVLLTPNTHTFGYRHGHSALYIGSGELLEATEIGEPVSVTEAAYWGSYPAGLHLRLTEEAAAETGMSREELGLFIAEYAQTNLLDDEYRLMAGLLNDGIEENETQCAHLIWAAFQSAGIDVSSRDFPVTPHSLLESGKFELIRCWGFDPKDTNW